MQDEAAPPIESPAEFERVLGLGLGRAILFLRQHDAWPYRDIILHACTHWTGYDQQVEGTRTTYLRDVLDATGHESWFVGRFLPALKNTSDRHDATQLAFLALSLAQDGYDEARSALYEKFDQNDAEEAFLGADAIIRLDKLEGFRYVAERIGSSLLADERGAVEVGSLLWEAKEAIGEEAARQMLAGAATPGLQAFARAVKEDDEVRSSRSARRLNLNGAPYEQVRQVILESRPTRLGVRGLGRWGENASADDLARAATDLLTEENDHRLTSYLRIFQERAFPLDPERLLTLMDHPNDRVMLAAADALSRVADPRVRARGLELLTNPEHQGSLKAAGVDLLVSNFQPGDEALLANLIRTRRDSDELHWIGMGTRDLLKANPSADALPIRMALYEYGPCSFCRYLAAQALHKRPPRNKSLIVTVL